MNQENNQLTKNNFSKIRNASLFFTTIIASISTVAVSAFAASTLGTQLQTIFKTCYSDVSTVFDIAAILALGVCLLTLLFGRGSKSAEKSYEWLKTIIICFIVFHFLGTLIPWLSGLFGSAVDLSTITGIDAAAGA